MELKVDKEADALYLTLDSSTIVGSQEVSPGVVVDYNDRNEIVGIEILHLSKRAKGLNVRELTFETV